MLILISDEILFNFGGFINMNLLGLVLLFVLFIKNQNHRFYADIIQQRVVLENQLYKKKLKSFNFKFGIKRKLLNILKNNTSCLLLNFKVTSKSDSVLLLFSSSFF